MNSTTGRNRGSAIYPAAVGAIIGISWLPLIFGPYFGLKLLRSGAGPRSVGKSIGLAAVGFVLVFGGAFVAFSPPIKGIRLIGGFALMVVGAILQFSPWPALAKTLLAYAYAARIPVAIVMFFAMQGNWGTHYDVVPPNYTGPTTFWAKYVDLGLIPQLLFWIAFTLTLGAFLGSVAAAIARRRRASPQTA